ncbi:MAG: hypothetical protein EA367_10265 [Leptolyngbya sp. DLM2.Bin15]|nr:MAG: hypothetical protein EA367_10265 [Leptolyngbya sp. DLM2.Bin15]
MVRVVHHVPLVSQIWFILGPFRREIAGLMGQDSVEWRSELEPWFPSDNANITIQLGNYHG